MEKEQNKTDIKDIPKDKKESSEGVQEASKKEDKHKNEEQVKEKSPEEKILELEDKLSRTFAEMENQRRRFERERDDAYEYGGFTFAKEALNLIDNLERSKQILLNDDSLKETEALKKTLEHFNIINKDLIAIFSKNHIKPIESINKKLDPNFHQAMIEIEDDQKEAGVIIQEIQKGFTMKDRLLRPALVGVAKKTESKIKKDKENKENLGNK